MAKKPQERNIYYSKGQGRFYIIVSLLMLVLSIRTIVVSDFYFIAIFLMFIAIFTAFTGIKMSKNKTPQFTISDKGVQWANGDFHDWKFINNEKVVRRYSGKNSTYFLIYEYKAKRKSYILRDYKISSRKLNILLRTYRKRNKNYQYRH